MTRKPDLPLLDSPEAIVDALELFIGPEDRCRRSLWIVWLDADGRPLPVVVPMDDRPLTPDPGLLEGLIHVIASQAEPGGEVLLTLTRPGGQGVEEGDRAWFHALHQAAETASVRLGPIHLGTEHGIRALHPDDVM
jgi:hypothetical protein